jgi:methylmalonyl-CoA mutase C-terminal domain/subunit
MIGMEQERRIRAVVGKIGLDGHDRGVKVIARAFRDAGMEVIYTGLRRTSDELAEVVVQEDADVLGLSVLSGAVIPLTTRVMAALRDRDREDVVVVVGGIISPQIARQLQELGVAGAFGPGTPLGEIVDFVQDKVVRGGGALPPDLQKDQARE